MGSHWCANFLKSINESRCMKQDLLQRGIKCPSIWIKNKDMLMVFDLYPTYNIPLLNDDATLNGTFDLRTKRVLHLTWGGCIKKFHVASTLPTRFSFVHIISFLNDITTLTLNNRRLPTIKCTELYDPEACCMVSKRCLQGIYWKRYILLRAVFDWHIKRFITYVPLYQRGIAHVINF
jgi:hypothetical protein